LAAPDVDSGRSSAPCFRGTRRVLANYREPQVASSGVILILVVRFAPMGFAGLAAGRSERQSHDALALLEVVGLSKHYGGLIAIDNVDLRI
jgi:hypothetical protein